MTRTHPPLPEVLPPQTLALVHRGRGPSLVELRLLGTVIERRFGPVGGPWQTKREEVQDPQEAYRVASTQIGRLFARGYELRHRNAELEAVIADSPDDPAAYLVYADWLAAQGSPLGEYISVATALDDAPDNEALIARETRILTAQALLTSRPHWAGLRWRCGFVEGVETTLELERSLRGQTSLRLPGLLAYDFRGQTRHYHGGQDLTEGLNSVRKHPLGAFVRRVYARGRCYRVRPAPPSEAQRVGVNPGWELWPGDTSVR